MSNADATYMASNTVSPLSCFFATAYNHTYTDANGTHTFNFGWPDDSLGWLGGAIASGATYVEAINAQANWGSLPVFAYEGGNGWASQGTPFQSNTAFINLLVSASTDIRFSYLYYDPTAQLSSNPGYLPSCVASTGAGGIGLACAAQFQEMYINSAYGWFGATQTKEQTLSNTTTPEWMGINNYSENG
jgi:hypothetical protein